MQDIRLVLKFPFLIGKLQTSHSGRCTTKKERFPFLIGKLQTEDEDGVYVEWDAEFPFLIGKLQTRRFPFLAVHIEKFPFLIGKLQTGSWRNLAYRLPTVSIPHR